MIRVTPGTRSGETSWRQRPWTMTWPRTLRAPGPTDTDSVDRDAETNFNIYLIDHNVEEPIKDDKEVDAGEEKKPKTNKVEKITWD